MFPLVVATLWPHNKEQQALVAIHPFRTIPGEPEERRELTVYREHGVQSDSSQLSDGTQKKTHIVKHILHYKLCIEMSVTATHMQDAQRTA